MIFTAGMASNVGGYMWRSVGQAVANLKRYDLNGHPVLPSSHIFVNLMSFISIYIVIVIPLGLEVAGSGAVMT